MRRIAGLTEEEGAMESRCDCGGHLDHAFDAFGCIECGQPCCPACAVWLESVAYCACCAGVLMETPASRR